MRHLKALQRSEHTIRGYKTDLTRFFGWTGKSFDELARNVGDEYVEHLSLVRKLKPASIRRMIHALSSFYTYCVKNEWMAQNPFDGLQLPKLPEQAPKWIPERELMRIFVALEDVCRERDDWISWRNLSVVELLYATGLRRAEAESLNIKDVDFEDRTIRVKGKGKKVRTVRFGGAAREALLTYLEKRGDKGGEALFITERMERIKNIYRLVRELTGHHPHEFRHSMGRHLHVRGMPIADVQALLGHASVATTQIYVAAGSEALGSYDVYHPRG